MPDKPVTDHEKEVSDDREISTQPPISIGGSPPMGITMSPATTTTPDKPVTDHEKEVSDDRDISTQPPISIGGSPPTGRTIAAVLGVIVIVGILLGIAILLAVLYRRVKWRPRVPTKSALNLQNTTVTLIGK
jgi:hypothetical protein